jgi:hypothetical protein
MPRRNRHRGGNGGGRWGSPRKRDPDWEPDVRPERSPSRRDRSRHNTAGATAELPVWSEPVVAPAVAALCGNCREWYPDEIGGRGDCAHPGSGFLRPWSDTPACPFFDARR